MRKYTKGPWHFYAHQPHHGFRIGGSAGSWQWFAEVFQAPGLEREGVANAKLIVAAPDLLDELIAAHKIISNGLNIMSDEQKALWGSKNEAEAITDGTAITRELARRKIIKKAGGEL